MKSPKEFRVLLVYPNLTMMLVPSIAMALFTGGLRKAGYTVDLFDTTHYVSDLTSSWEYRREYLQHRPFDVEKDLGVSLKTDILGDFVKKVNEFNPDLLVVSVVEDTFLQAVALLDAVKDAEIPHLMGGVFITAAPEVALSYPQVNMIGRGEGEETVLEVAERLRRGESCQNVMNVSIKGQDGMVVNNPMRPLVDINKPLPDFSLFDEARFYRPFGGRVFKTVPLETYRGCPYGCTFCNSPMQAAVMRTNGLGTFMRRKKIDVLREEIKHLVKTLEPEYFFIVDDSFLARPESEIHEFVAMYDEFKIPFWFNTRPENASGDRLASLKSINCDRMSFGLECGNEDFRRNVVKRHPTNQEIVESFKGIAQSGIAFSVNNIIGFPGETRDMIFDTIDLNRQLRGYDATTVSIFTPYHGTELRTLAVEKGYIDPDVITKHTISNSLLKMPHLPSEEIDGLIRTFPLYVRFPKDEWTKIRQAEANTEEGKLIYSEYQKKYRDQFFNSTQADSLEDWDAPSKYSVVPDSPTSGSEKPWGFNCGVEQRQYAVPPQGVPPKESGTS